MGSDKGSLMRKSKDCMQKQSNKKEIYSLFIPYFPPDHPCSEETFPNIQSKPSLVHFESHFLSPCLLLPRRTDSLPGYTLLTLFSVVENNNVSLEPPVKVPLNAIPALQCVSCPTQLNVVSKPAVGALDATVHVTDKNGKKH